jgi:hypothetical protein
LFNKKPAIDWQSRVFRNLFLGLEDPSHDASAPIGAMPHGRLSIDSLAAQANVTLLLHLLTQVRDNIPGALSKAILIDAQAPDPQ